MWSGLILYATHLPCVHVILQVVFADGTFIDGSTSEVSCDGPLREPFVVFCQVWPASLPIFGLLQIVCSELCSLGTCGLHDS